MFRIIVPVLFISIIVFACGTKENIVTKPYNGPLIEAYNIETFYTDSSKLKIKVNSPKELEYESGDRYFPDGIYMEFYDEQGKKSSYLKGKKARYFKDKDIYVVTEKVVVQNIGENKNLKTEELTWHPSKKQITSDKFVTITTPDEILTGDGLISNEDFSNYKILKPKATIFLD